MKTKCEHCGVVQEVPDEYAGKKLKCLRCSELFTVEKFVNSFPQQPLTQPVEQQITQAQTVHIHTVPTGVSGLNGFGLASLLLGLFAALSCWIPLINWFGIPFSVLGVALGTVGIVLAARGRCPGIGLAIAGTAVSFLAFAIAVAVNLLMAVALAAESNGV